MIGNILIGLLLLSFLVFVHELGHFIAARLCGVEVIAFSVGFGPILLKKKIGDTEYRLSLLPFGGYCSMRGEDAFMKALDENLDTIPNDPASLYGVSRWRRILIAFAGPFANYVTAILGFTLVAAIGTSYYTSSNQIAPSYYYGELEDSPAKGANLQMGDRIVQIDGIATNTFTDVYEKIALNPEKAMTFTIERNGSTFQTEITPALNKDTGAGYVGFYAYIPMDIAEVLPDSPAQKAGILAGDRITAVNGEPIYNTHDLAYFFKNNLHKMTVDVTIERNGQEQNLSLDLPYYSETQMPSLGLVTESIQVIEEGQGFFKSIAEGFVKTNTTIIEVLKSLTLLFKGINFRSALAGPLGISSMLGENAKAGFRESFLQGLYTIASLASFICISLFIMNLLPIPVLDGGIIFIALIEIIVRRSVRPKILYYVQMVGTFLILFLFVFALWADIGRLFFS